MTAFGKSDQHNNARLRRIRLQVRLALLLGWLTTLLVLPGCGGCSEDPKDAQQAKKAAKEKKEKKKPDFEVPNPRTRPGSSGKRGRNPTVQRPSYKPGHWTSMTQVAKTNNFDFTGSLEVAIGDRHGEPLALPGTPFELGSVRDVKLAKGYPKSFEATFYVPPVDHQAVMTRRLNPKRGGRETMLPNTTLRRMPPYQYHFAVLARSPDRYTYLGRLASIRPWSSQLSEESLSPYYRVALIRADARNRVALPSDALYWTSIACVLWDDAQPKSLNPSQQRALIDWLHWGGQLILSGPETLDTLRDSFLAPYLPAEATGTRELTAADFQPLREWSNRRKSGKPHQPLTFAPPWAGVQLKKHREGRFLPGSGELLVERRLGRGRIVVSAFPLWGRNLRTWTGLDELFNAFLLSRKPRTFMDGVDAVWADRHDPRDAAYVCNLRYFTRNTPQKDDAWSTSSSTAADDDPTTAWGPGVAGWDDFGPVPRNAYRSLKKAAQIEIPDRSFVVWVLAAYLVVLVPANWIVFRLLGHVEWAWIAAPLIAVVCTVTVIRLARLDIGFVRARTEISVVEIQAEHPRAHVTRYTALYTSLRTGYEFRFDDTGAQLQPLPPNDDPSRFSMRLGQGRQQMSCYRGDGVRMTGFSVASNSLGMVHSEQIVDLAGGLKLAESQGRFPQLTNSTELTLRGVGIVRRDKSGHVEIDWHEQIKPGATVSLHFARSMQKNLQQGRSLWAKQRERSAATRSRQSPGVLSLHRLAILAEDLDGLEVGDVRLIAVATEPIPGLTIRPSAPRRVDHVALVLAHLAHGTPENPQPDLNTLQSFPDARDENIDANEPEVTLENAPN